MKVGSFLLIAIFLTGFSSLIFELVWMRQLSIIFNASVYAVSIILAIFMLGLAAGSFFARRIENSRMPFKTLSTLQFLISCFSILALLSFQYLFSKYLSLFLMFISTFFIGMVLPFIAKIYHSYSQGGVGKTVSLVYFADLLGSVFGILLAGFILIWKLGLFKTSLLASIINAIMAVIIYKMLGNRSKDRKYILQHKKERWISLLFILFFITGFCALSLENVWIRSFSLIIGNSIISFTIVIVAFLLGLALGSKLAKRFIASFDNKFLFSLILLLIGLSSILLILVFPVLESVFLMLFYGISNYYLFLFALSIMTILTLIIPTALMGMTFPIISDIYSSGEKVAGDVGSLFSVNCLGSVVGSLVTGFILMQWLGLDATTLVMGLIYIMVAAVFILLYAKSVLMRFIKYFSYGFIILIILSVLFYQNDYFYGGIYYQVQAETSKEQYFESKASTEILFEKHSPYSLITVTSAFNKTYLRTNGRPEASGNELMQDMLAHLPLGYHPNPKTVLNIGHGGGYTLNAILTYPVEEVDTVEIDKVVIEANKYIDETYASLSDPRVNLIIDDARGYLRDTSKKYDVIITETSHPWANPIFFTKEFYELTKNRLNEGGIYSIWVPAYEMVKEDYDILVNTINSVFPYYKEFPINEIEFIVLASDKPFNNNTQLDWRAMTTEVGDTRLNTDDKPVLERNTWRNKYYKFRE